MHQHFQGEPLDFSLRVDREDEAFDVEIVSRRVAEPDFFSSGAPWNPVPAGTPQPTYGWVVQRRRTLLAGVPAQQECRVVLETGERRVTYFIEVTGRPVRIDAHIPFLDAQEEWPRFLATMESLRIEEPDAGL